MEEKTPKPRRRSRAKATIKEETASAPQPAPQPEKQAPGTSNQPEQDDKTIKIEIQKYKALVDALGDYRSVFRAILTIFLVGVLLFTGITAVVIAVKRFYPYSDIVTNTLGATTLKNEDKEVSYWLLNTADLWAKSGIMVKKGQTITVRASGKKHTAMHHLYEDANGDAPDLREPWVGTKGFSSREDKRGPRDSTRAKYKIFPEENQDALLMQIAPVDGKPDIRPRFIKKLDNDTYDFIESKNRFIVIGDRQENIYINEDGILYFAINDIVLDDATIAGMMWNISKNDYNVIPDEKIKSVMHSLDSLRQDHIKTHKTPEQFRNDTVAYKAFLKAFEINVPKDFLSKNTKNKNTDHEKVSFGDFAFGTTKQTNFIELYGYFMYEYLTPWYDDNLGSFLIVVESSTN